MSVFSDSRVERRKAATPLLGSGPLRPERILRLRGAFDEFAVQCAESLHDLVTSPVQLAMRELCAGKAGEFLAGQDALGAVAVFRNAEPNAPVLIGADGACLDAMLEAAFGADGSEPSSGSRRPLSAVELGLAGAMFQLVAKVLHASYAVSGSSPLHLDSVGCLANQPRMVRLDDEWLIANFDLETLGRKGKIFTLLPPHIVQRLQKPANASLTGPVASDPRWNTRIQRELTRTHVTLQAVLDERDLTLGEIADLKVGQMLPLRVTPQSQVKLGCNDQTLFWCELGQAEGAYTLRVRDFADEERGMIDAILSA